MAELKAVSGMMKETEEKITEYSTKKNDIERKIKVRSVENGFIVEILEDGYKKDKKGNKEWYYAKQTYISTTDPLDDADAATPDVTDVIKNAVNNLTL